MGHRTALGTFCIYEASSIEKIREPAQRAGIPATDIFEVADTVVVRSDPVALAAWGAVSRPNGEGPEPGPSPFSPD